MSKPAKEGDSGEPTFELKFRLNGEERTIGTWPARRMLAVLREELGLTGTKRSCEIGRCGACMVLLDGEPVNSCLLSAYQCSGADLVTIEGLQGERAGRVKAAFLQEGGFQCGYCTPGMVISVSSLLEHNRCPSRLETEEALAGNICRCTGYGSIFRAVCRASEGMAEMPPAE
ncbi:MULTISPECIES: (2Fe-2S)-binding protein [unclassified Paenibacillus]|uniref:(2Fe-2S)-binding protein n=1 Tax=unclassified Paenibacillus TaxID=185978 RepID=UPI0009709519|nr:MULTISPECIES: (2Fe-2S)-binding protein [unclassified Paenibacillus]ASS69266.1 (2Fe-2S)-binding protein [Paenibacillus sp. RUD330]